MVKSVIAFQSEFPTKSSKAFHEVQYALQFAADQNVRTPAEMLKRWKAGKPLIITTGYLKHATAFILFQDLCFVIDRGGSSLIGIEIHQFSKQNLTEEVVSMIVGMHENQKRSISIWSQSSCPLCCNFRSQRRFKSSKRRCSFPPDRSQLCLGELRRSSFCCA